MTNTVLIIHDDEFLRETYATKLDFEGFTVDTAADVPIGLTKALATEPDLILFGAHMLRLTSVKFLRAYQPVAGHPGAPTVIMSHESAIGDITLARLLATSQSMAYIVAD